MPEDAAPPPLPWAGEISFGFDNIWVEPGGQIELSIYDGVPNARVAVVASDGGFGRGPCPAWLGGRCLSVVRGTTWDIVPVQLDFRGEATVRLAVPVGVVGDDYAVQVVDPASAVASPSVEFHIVPSWCMPTQGWPDCGPLPPTPYATGPIFATVEAAYDPVTDAAVPWTQQGSPTPRPPSIELIVNPDAGIYSEILMPCFVTLEATGPVPRAPWSTTTGRRRFGFDLTVGVNATVSTHCPGSDIGAAELAAFLTDVIECQTFSVEIEEGTGPAATEYLYGKNQSFQIKTGMTIRYADRCGDPVQSHPMVGDVRETRADMTLMGMAPYLTGQRRFTVNAAGERVPARGLWWAHVVDWDPYP
jgi:hypothetical protein